MPSLAHSTNHSANATHEPVAAGDQGEQHRRHHAAGPTVTALAQVAMALGSWLSARPPTATGGARLGHQVRPERVDHDARRANSPTARESGTWTTPSISGASR